MSTTVPAKEAASIVPRTGLQFHDVSNTFGQNAPLWPYFPTKSLEMSSHPSLGMRPHVHRQRTGVRAALAPVVGQPPPPTGASLRLALPVVVALVLWSSA